MVNDFVPEWLNSRDSSCKGNKIRASEYRIRSQKQIAFLALYIGITPLEQHLWFCLTLGCG